MNRDSRASKPEDDATGKLLDELLSDKDCLRIQVIRRTDVLRFVDLTTLERTIGLEMRVDSEIDAEYLPLGLLGAGSILGSFKVQDSGGSRLVTPARGDARKVAESILLVLLTKTDAATEEDCKRIEAMLSCSAREPCEECVESFWEGSYDKKKEQFTKLGEWRRHQLGCRSLSELLLDKESEGARRPDRLRKKFIRRLFDFSESLPLSAEWPETSHRGAQAEVVYVSYSFHEDIEPWLVPKVSKYRKLRSSDARCEKLKWWWRSNYTARREKRHGQLADQGPLIDHINKTGNKRRYKGFLRLVSGYRSLSILWEQGTIADQRSYHVDIEVPDGLVIPRATTLVAVLDKTKDPKESEQANHANEVGHGAHIVVGKRTSDDKPRLRRRVKSMTIIEVVPADSTLWLTGSIVGFVSALLLTAVAYRWSSIFEPGSPESQADRLSATVSLLVVAPTLVAAFLAVRASNEIGERLLHGLQRRLAFIALLTATGAVVLTLGGENASLAKSAPYVLAVLALLTAISLLLGWWSARSDQTTERFESDDDEDLLRDFSPPSKFVRSAEGARWVPHGWPDTWPDTSKEQTEDAELWSWTDKVEREKTKYGNMRKWLEPILAEDP